MTDFPDLTEDQRTFLSTCTTKFLDSFKSEKDSSIKQLKLVFTMIKNQNKNVAENFKTISLTNEKFKRIKDNNEYFIQYLTDVGFTKQDGYCPMGNDAKYKYLTEGGKGNIKNLEHILTLI
jgi:hypothetical protein